jgi:hypothetical protein
MPEPFFTDHAWDYANDPDYRRRFDRLRRVQWTCLAIVVVMLAIALVVL